MIRHGERREETGIGEKSREEQTAEEERGHVSVSFRQILAIIEQVQHLFLTDTRELLARDRREHNGQRRE